MWLLGDKYCMLQHIYLHMGGGGGGINIITHLHIIYYKLECKRIGCCRSAADTGYSHVTVGYDSRLRLNINFK